MSRKIPLIILIFFISFSKVSTLRAQYQTYSNAVKQGTRCYQLTDKGTSRTGAIISDQQYNVNADFVIAGTLNFGDDAMGADGIAFIMLPDPTALSGTLQFGEGIGYAGLPNALVIEFDSFRNRNVGDPPYDHIALLANSNPDHSKASNISGPFRANASGNIKDGLNHDFLIVWDAKVQLLTLWFDCKKVFGYQGDISRPFLGSSKTFYAGFTASTGGQTNIQTVCFKTPTQVDILKDQTYCDSATVVLDGGVNGLIFNWTPAQGLSDPHSSRPTIFLNKSRTFYLNKLDNCGNETVDSLIIKIVPNDLKVSLGNDTVLCENASLVIGVPTGGLNYKWNTGATTQNITVTKPGMYSIQVDDGICIRQDEINIDEKSLPTVSLPADTLACDHDPIRLKAAYPGAAVRWSTGSTDSLITVTEPGNYTAELTNECGTVRDDINIDYENCSLYYIPNAFTPNHDGTNDYFGPAPSSAVIRIEQFYIFDRWGGQVYGAHNIDPRDESLLWNGYFKGKLVDPGIYAYLIRLQMKNGKIINAKGDVMVVR